MDVDRGGETAAGEALKPVGWVSRPTSAAARIQSGPCGRPRDAGSAGSLPAGDASCLLDPLSQGGLLRVAEGRQLDVARPIGGAEWRRRVEVGAPQEDDVYGDVLGNHLDDPAELGQAVVRLTT